MDGSFLLLHRPTQNRESTRKSDAWRAGKQQLLRQIHLPTETFIISGSIHLFYVPMPRSGTYPEDPIGHESIQNQKRARRAIVEAVKAGVLVAIVVAPGEPLDMSDRIGHVESEVARIAGVFQETTGAVSAESAARVSFEQKVQANVQDRFWSYRCDIAMFMKDIALSINNCKSRTVGVEQRLSE
jgi:hypothetical protein